MTGGFAGSRTLDDRRRRRIASENDEGCDSDVSVETEPPAPQGGDTVDVSPDDDLFAEEPAPGSMPIRRLISRRYWKLFVVAGALFSIGVGLLRLGFMSARGELSSHWGVVVPGFNPLVRFYLTIIFGLSAQLAVFIALLRSESPRDYTGRYRVWHWAAGLCGLASLWSATDLHILLANGIGLHYPAPILNAGLLYWLIPVIAVSFVVLGFLNREVSPSPLSCAFLWMAVLAFATATVIWSGLAGDVGWLPLTGSAMFGAFSVFATMLFHTRYVAYVSADPDRNEAPLRRAARRVGVALRMKRRRRRLQQAVRAADRAKRVAERQADKLAKAAAKQAAKAAKVKAVTKQNQESADEEKDSLDPATLTEKPQRAIKRTTAAKPTQRTKAETNTENAPVADKPPQVSDRKKSAANQDTGNTEPLKTDEPCSKLDQLLDQHANPTPPISRKQRKKARQKRRAA